MASTPRAMANRALFQAFINCYLREVDSGHWLSSHEALDDRENSENSFLVLELPFSRFSIVMEVAYYSVVGCHHFERIFSKPCNLMIDSEWAESDPLFILQIIIHDIYQSFRSSIEGSINSDNAIEKSKENEIEFLARLVDSAQVMAKFISSRSYDDELYSVDFLLTEQSSLYGHWLHPTPKSRQGMAFWALNAYSPEANGKFKLHYFSVDKNLIKQGSVLKHKASDIIKKDLHSTVKLDIPEHHFLIPIHPLQACFLKLQPWVLELLEQEKIIDLGALGVEFTPTSSVRTVTHREAQWMYKFSIPVKITNSLRSNMRDELEDGMAVERYLRKSGFLKENPSFGIVDDPAYITIERPDQPNVESGFEVILRRNIFSGEAGSGVVSILALAQDPLSSGCDLKVKSLLQHIIFDIAKSEGRTHKAVALDWFSKYWYCSIEPLILLYDQHGIALEAHQQNSLLDISGGYPRKYYYRDNQGFYLSLTHKKELSVIDEMSSMSDIFYQDEVIFEAISYYIFINQLFSIVYRMGADDLVEEKVLLIKIRELLISIKSKLKGVGLYFVDHILSCNKLSYKTNLLARVHDIDELHEGMEREVYATLNNPLHSQSSVTSIEVLDLGVVTNFNDKRDCYAI
ncbi:IucA/IucC family protein [Marinagarivorans algicola]|uniref:IucA/IucC family protein n=1 Tax=Marinagarivorans algicola TaxID=1513270 RepID=UPI0006B89634|nr:IucA/IucC family protein [Marinagarivorans algicola]